MATKLKNLKVTKVDFVDEGANPDAHIKLFKRKDEPAKGTQAYGSGRTGEDNSWKRVVSAIAKAAGINANDLRSAVEEIQKADSESFGEKMERRKISRVTDEIWDICYALESSLCSIMFDDETDSAGKQSAMQESLTEFNNFMTGAVPQWAQGKLNNIIAKSDEPMTAIEIGIAKHAKDRLDKMIGKAKTRTDDDDDDPDGIWESDDDDDDDKKEEKKDMKIDKSRLTEAERAFLESIEKRYGEEEPSGTAPAGNAPASQTPPAAQGSQGGIAKNASASQTPAASAAPAGNTPASQAPANGSGSGTEDIWKGVHPAVRAEMEALKKFRQEAEDREITEVAKKYEIIGKKPEELAPVLKSLKAAGGTAYDDMIAVLDSAVGMVEKSGVFGEIGKSGHGDDDGGSWAQAEAKATELMKSRAGITKAQALDEVFMADPALAAKCEEEG